MRPEVNSPVSAAEANGCEAFRQKHWSELKEHERIDRLREVVKRYEQRLEIAEAFIHAFLAHKHANDGALCGPFDPHRNMPQMAKLAWAEKACDSQQQNPDAVYF